MGGKDFIYEKVEDYFIKYGNNYSCCGTYSILRTLLQEYKSPAVMRCISDYHKADGRRGKH
jgi:hypothetical protein